MNFQKIAWWLFFLGSILFVACDSEPPKEEDMYTEKILGHWEVFEAVRNEKPTTTLENAYFDFATEGAAILNLTGLEQSAKYEILEQAINITGTQMDGEYKIDKLSGDTLILSTAQKFNEISYQFIFRMIKKEKEAIE